MDPISLVVLLAGVVLAAVGAWLMNEGSRARRAYALKEEELKQERAKLEKKAPAKISKPVKAEEPKPVKAEAPQKSKALEEAQDEVKELKKQVYDLKQELKDARSAEKKARESQSGVDQTTLLEAREELSAAKSEMLKWKAKAETLEAQGKKVKAVEPTEDAPVAPVKVTYQIDEDELDRLRAENEKLRSGKESTRSMVDERRRIEAEFKKKLSNAARQTDQERRRADNNDKAYKVTQRQLDAARERLEFLEAELKRAQFAPAKPAATPTPAPVEKAAEPAATPAPEPAAEKPTAEVEDKPVVNEDLTKSEDTSAIDDAWADLDIEDK
jgi:HAMP domain-containing protein